MAHPNNASSISQNPTKSHKIPLKFAEFDCYFWFSGLLFLVFRRQFTQKFANIQKVGAHISADKSRIDFEWPESITPLLAEFQQRAQAVIDSDAEIESAFSDEGQERRYWKVEGFAQVPCGGTHLKRTSEVGRIALKRKNVGKGKERVEITLVS